jgi:hypothetical protein
VTAFAETIAEVRRLHGGHLTEVEELLLALVFLEGRPLRAGSDVVDARALVRSRLMVEQGMGAREALAWARQSDGEAGVTLDDCLRIGGLRSVYVDPYVVDREGGEGWARSGIVATRGDAGEEDGVLGGVAGWRQFGAEDEPVLLDEDDQELIDPEVTDVDEPTLERWRLWLEEGDG